MSAQRQHYQVCLQRGGHEVNRGSALWTTVSSLLTSSGQIPLQLLPRRIQVLEWPGHCCYPSISHPFTAYTEADLHIIKTVKNIAGCPQPFQDLYCHWTKILGIHIHFKLWKSNKHSDGDVSSEHNTLHFILHTRNFMQIPKINLALLGFNGLLWIKCLILQPPKPIKQSLVWLLKRFINYIIIYAKGSCSLLSVNIISTPAKHFVLIVGFY